MQELRANTEVKVVIGPAVDFEDGVTPETGITLGAADQAEILKHNAASVTDIAGATWAAITGCDGYYNLTITTSLSDTEGMLTVVVQDASVCLPIRQNFMVLSESAWDSKYIAKDDGLMDVNVKTINDVATTSVTTISANVGTTQPVNFTGTGASAYAKSDVTMIGTAAQSATDLKDFADTGYDPSTHKVAGVVLTDTCTTNSDMRGTDSAALASVCTEARLAELGSTNLPADIDQIKGDTTTDIPATLATIVAYLDTEIAAILEDTGTTLPAAIAALNNLSATDLQAALGTNASNVMEELTQAAPGATPSVAAALMLIYMALRNKMTQTSSEAAIYNDAGTKIAKAVLSDDGTTLTKAEYGSGA